MSRFLIRIISLLLVACSVVDPSANALASAFSNSIAPVRQLSQMDRTPFQEQALVSRLLHVLRPPLEPKIKEVHAYEDVYRSYQLAALPSLSVARGLLRLPAGVFELLKGALRYFFPRRWDPRRGHNMLVLPGDNVRNMQSAARSAASVIVFDLQDTVKDKAAARRIMIDQLRTMKRQFKGKRIFIRLNHPRTEWAAADAEEVLNAVGDLITGIIIRKVQGPEDIVVYDRILTAIERAHGWPVGRLEIQPFIDLPEAVLQADAIARSSPRVTGLIFGLVGYLTGTGAKPEASDEPFLYPLWAKTEIVQAARRAGIEAIDGLTQSHEDVVQTAVDAVLSAALGFAGKWNIHPRQIHAVDDPSSVLSERDLLDISEKVRATLVVLKTEVPYELPSHEEMMTRLRLRQLWPGPSPKRPRKPMIPVKPYDLQDLRQQAQRSEPLLPSRISEIRRKTMRRSIYEVSGGDVELIRRSLNTVADQITLVEDGTVTPEKLAVLQQIWKGESRGRLSVEPKDNRVAASALFHAMAPLVSAAVFVVEPPTGASPRSDLAAQLHALSEELAQYERDHSLTQPFDIEVRIRDAHALLEAPAELYDAIRRTRRVTALIYDIPDEARAVVAKGALLGVARAAGVDAIDAQTGRQGIGLRQVARMGFSGAQTPAEAFVAVSAMHQAEGALDWMHGLVDHVGIINDMFTPNQSEIIRALDKATRYYGPGGSRSMTYVESSGRRTLLDEQTVRIELDRLGAAAASGELRDEQPLVVAGITGDLGSGKSTVTSLFKKLGAEAVDANAITYKLMQPHQPLWENIVESFPGDILNQDDAINRQRLADLVFKNPEQRKRLEEIVHPIVLDAIIYQIDRLKEERNARLVVIDMPFALATRAQRSVVRARKLLDALVVVNIAPEAQRARLSEKFRWSREYIEARLDAEMDMAAKTPVADYRLNNAGTEEETEAQVRRLWAPLVEHRWNQLTAYRALELFIRLSAAKGDETITLPATLGDFEAIKKAAERLVQQDWITSADRDGNALKIIRKDQQAVRVVCQGGMESRQNERGSAKLHLINPLGLAKALGRFLASGWRWIISRVKAPKPRILGTEETMRAIRGAIDQNYDELPLIGIPNRSAVYLRNPRERNELLRNVQRGAWKGESIGGVLHIVASPLVAGVTTLPDTDDVGSFDPNDPLKRPYYRNPQTLIDPISGLPPWEVRAHRRGQAGKRGAFIAGDQRVLDLLIQLGKENPEAWYNQAELRSLGQLDERPGVTKNRLQRLAVEPATGVERSKEKISGRPGWRLVYRYVDPQRKNPAPKSPKLEAWLAALIGAGVFFLTPYAWAQAVQDSAVSRAPWKVMAAIGPVLAVVGLISRLLLQVRRPRSSHRSFLYAA